MIVNKPKKKKEISRYGILFIIMFCMFSIILLKLLYLQVLKYDTYKDKADTSSIKFISDSAPRGIIYDSDGNILATNEQTYTLTFMQTTEATNALYSTMSRVFSVLEENGEEFQDDFILKANSAGGYYFEFTSTSTAVKESVELLFKSDRGIKDQVVADLDLDTDTDYTDEELAKINEALLAISPEETFYYLVDLYGLYNIDLPENYTDEEKSALSKEYTISSTNATLDDYIANGKKIVEALLKNHTVQEIRKYMVVKDAIFTQSYEGYKSVTIANSIEKETAFIFYQLLDELPGIDVSLQPIRNYPFSTLASAVLGYVSTISSTEEEIYELKGYDSSTDLVGASGIEAAFEEQLKGTDGGTTVRVNSSGRITEELFQLETTAGNNVHLTIDKDVQYAAEQSLADAIERVQEENDAPSATRGAVVAIENKTGRVIAMASYPSYDPNDFATGSLTDELYDKYFNPDYETFGKEHIKSTGATYTLDELFPENESGVREDKYDIYPKYMYNYATQGLIPPGSTFKPLTAIAGLMEGVITTDETMSDVGIWTNDDLGLSSENFQKHANGTISVREALMYSSNFFFYETGYRMYKNAGADTEALDVLANYAYKFGLGVAEGENAATGIEIEENFGQTYNFNSWKNKILSTPMYTLVESLQNGSYGSYSFVPFDISKIDTDDEKLADLKSELKSNISSTLELVGTDSQVTDGDEYASSILEYVKAIMNASDVYQESLKKYNDSKSTNTTVDDQAIIVANALAQYTIYDQTTEIDSGAQVVYDAIGQSMNSFTPLQMASYVATLSNGGTRYKVRLVDKITSSTGEVLQEFEPEVLDQLDIPEEYLSAVKEGMYMVNTYSGNGYAYTSFKDFPIKVAGKTGTADFSTDENYVSQGRKAYGNYISFAPLDDPEISIFVTIYDSGKGSSNATVALAIYEAYFKDYLLENYPDYCSSSSSFKKYVLNAPSDNKEGSESEESEESSENTEDSAEKNEEESNDNSNSTTSTTTSSTVVNDEYSE